MPVAVVANPRTAVKSCHGIGKSFAAAILAAWWIDVHPPGTVIVVTTATTGDQVHAIVWAEIKANHAAAGLPGRILESDQWKLNDLASTLVGIGRKPKDTDEHGFQGIHRRYVLAILDEAWGVPEVLWGGEAITTNADCRILAIENPDDPNTEFGRSRTGAGPAGTSPGSPRSTRRTSPTRT